MTQPNQRVFHCADTELVAAIDAHTDTCEIGPARCTDCALRTDIETRSAITTARHEHTRIRTWIHQHPDTCVYCGEPSDDMDHLVPRPWTGNAIRRYVPTVPACHDCNIRISAAPTFTIAGRAELVATSLRTKWRKELAIPDRDHLELRQFKGKMRHNIKAAQARRQTIRRRLINLDAGGAATIGRAAA